MVGSRDCVAAIVSGRAIEPAHWRRLNR